jgi:competence protein ComEA
VISVRMKRALAIAATCATMFRAAPAFAQHTGANRAATHATRGEQRQSTTQTTTAAEGVVNINTAGEAELRRLPGVGPSRAAAIVALRQRVQRFHAADDLLRVRGIGRAGMRRLRPYVTLSGETTLTARPGRAAAATSQEGGAN